MLDDLVPLALADRTDLAEREEDLSPLDYARGTLLVKEGNQGLAGLQAGDSLVGVELRVGPESLGCHLDGLLVARSESAQRMLYAVSELAQDVVRDIGRTLGDEIHAHTLAPDQADDLLDLVRKGLRCVVEQHVGLVEEEYELRKVHVTDFRKRYVKLREQPEEECGIKLRLEHQLVGRKHAHHALAAFSGQQVVDVE